MRKTILLLGMLSVGCVYAQEHDGKVGINTQTPQATLDVKAKTNNGSKVLELQNSAGAKLVTTLDNGNVGIGTRFPERKLEIYSDTDHIMRLRHIGSNNFTDFARRPNDTFFIVNNTDGVWKNGLAIDREGNVGIGHEEPQAKLDVIGTAQLTDNGGALKLVGSDLVYTEYYPQGKNAGRKAWMGFGAANTNALAIVNEAAGAISINSTNGPVVLDTTENVRITRLPEGTDTDKVVVADTEGNLKARTLGAITKNIYTTDGTISSERNVNINTRLNFHNGEIVNTNPNAFRLAYGNRGMILRNDGASFWMLPTNENDKLGSWSDARPMHYDFTSKTISLNTDVNDGNVGIGTISPGIKLEVSSAMDHIMRVRHRDSNNFTDFARRSNDTFLILNNTDGVWKNGLAIDREGNVGIGHEVATQKLDVDGNARIRQLTDATALESTYTKAVVADANGNLAVVSRTTPTIPNSTQTIFGKKETVDIMRGESFYDIFLDAHNRGYNFYRYSGQSITLPPGKWIVYCGYLLNVEPHNRLKAIFTPQDSSIRLQNVWVRSMISDTKDDYKGDYGYASIPDSPILISTNVTSGSVYNFASGLWMVDNNTASDKTYYVKTSIEPLGFEAGDTPGSKFLPMSNYREDYILAIRRQ